MKKLTLLLQVGLLLAATAGLSPAATLLYFADFNVGTSVVPGAVTLAGHSLYTASDTTDFNTQLALGPGAYPVAIFGHQDSIGTDEAVIAALTSFIAGGGRVIATTWEGTTTAGALEGAFVDSNASSITTDGHPIFAGLGASIGLTNPGWGVFSRSYSPFGGGSCIGSLGGGCAAILGNSGLTILNGPLFDTYANQGQGEQYIANQIGYLMGGSQIPEPSSFVFLSTGLLAAGLLRMRRKSS